nr:amidohydrolase family protein [Arenimonas sp.]
VSPHPRLEHCGALPLYDDFLATDFDTSDDFLATYPNFLHDRYTTPELPEGIDPADHTPMATVERIAATGARCVKLYYEEALWWPGHEHPPFSLPSLAILREVVDSAHARGLTVLMHGNTPAAHRIGLDAGIDVMAHGVWDWVGATGGHTDIPDDVLATADAVAGSAMKVQPTWMAAAGMTSLFDPDSLSDPRLTRVLGSAYLDYLRGPGQQAREDYLRRFGPAIDAAYARGEAATDQPARIMDTYLTRYRRILQRQHAGGAKFIFGSDTAVGTPGWGNPPGLSGYREMQAWVAADIDLRTLLRAATLDNAKAFGLDAELGSIEVGKRADLLLLTANPLQTLDAYDRIELIILGGEVIERDSLAADAPSSVGVSAIAIPAKGEAPDFTATLWYPSAPGIATRFGTSRIRPGYLAVADGTPRLPPSAPLIVLTHGTGGSAQSLAWLATELARRGALVVAADHPASSGGDPERASMMQVWTQPNDVRHLLDTLLASPWGTRIDRQRIASVGFSLGGASAMLLAGARLDFERFSEFCKTHDDGACRAFSRYFETVDAGFYARANGDLAEPRLRAAVAIAPGFTEAFTAESLRALPTPLLLVTGERDQQLPPQTHVYPMKHLLPANNEYREISNAHHYSFLPLCGEGAIELLAESSEEFVCQEFGAKSRPAIHAETLQAITEFLIKERVLRM